MDLDKYIELTGNEVDDSDKPKVNALIRRTRTILESMLGYSLLKKKASENQYFEKGKATVDCIFRGWDWNLSSLELSDPDEVEGSYRLFSYNHSDQYLLVDPFTALHKVKLVYVGPGEQPTGITHRTYRDDLVGIYQTGKVTKYIERYHTWFRYYCFCEMCTAHLQLAVDADWLNEECLPEELMLIWADMIQYYSDPNKDIKLEVLGTHKYEKNTLPKAEELPENITIIRRYAGQNGSVNQMPVI